MEGNTFPMTPSVPSVNANIDADFEDHSHIDDSIKQDGVSIDASNSTINMNSGNGRT